MLVSSRSSKKHKAPCRCPDSAKSAPTIAQRTHAESLAALASASTTAEEGSARAVAALASANTTAEKGSAGAVAALASASTTAKEAHNIIHGPLLNSNFLDSIPYQLVLLREDTNDYLASRKG